MRIISLGGGVQSTVMALMANDGGFGNPTPTCAIFADTGWEPDSLYTHLDWLAGQLQYPIHRVGSGRNLLQDVKNSTSSSANYGYVDIPLFLKGSDGRPGISRRHCTTNYKIVPIHREVRRLLGLAPRQRAPKGTSVEMCIGISVDEGIRMKPSRVSWIENRYPLIEAGMSRSDCLAWFQERYDRPLEKSACVGCPYQSPSRWVDMKRKDPAAFLELVSIDANLRSTLSLDSAPFLHQRRMPLADAVARDEAQGRLDDLDGFGNECEGYCGV